MTKKKKSSLIPLVIFQIGLVLTWYLGQEKILSPLYIGSLMLVITAGIFYTIYKRIPKTRNLFIAAYFFITMILVWLFILPSIS